MANEQDQTSGQNEVAAPQAPSTVSSVPPQSQVPMLDTGSTPLTATERVATQSEVVSDPTASASPAFSNLAQLPPPRTGGATHTRTGRKEVAPKKAASRGPLIAIAAVVLIAVALGIGLTVKNGMERKQIQEDITGMITTAQTAYAQGSIDEAALKSNEALERIKTSPQTLDGDLVKKWKERAKHFESMREEVAQAKVIAESAAKDLKSANLRLKSKKDALGVGDEFKPVIAKLDVFIGDIEKLEKKQKIDKLKIELAAADEIYRTGKILEAADRATGITKTLQLPPRVQDREIESRIEVLQKRAEQVKTAREIRLTGNKNFKDALKKLQDQADAIPESNEDLRPLKGLIVTLKKELQDEEKKSRKLSVEDTNELNAFTNKLKKLDRDLEVGTIDGETMSLKYDGKPLRLGFHRTALSHQIVFEAGDNRLTVENGALFGPKAHPNRVLRHIVALGEAMKKAGVISDDLWDATSEAPLPSARRSSDDGKEYVFLGDRLYVGKVQPKGVAQKDALDEFKKVTETLALSVEKDSGATDEIRKTISFAVRCSSKTPTEEDWFEHLRGAFVRDVVGEGYIEKNIPGSAERLQQPLADYRTAFAKISTPQLHYDGSTGYSDRASEYKTFEDHAIWHIYDKSAETTTFAIKDPDDEKNCLFILYEFPGKLETFPEKTQPKQIRMTHQAEGVIASFNPVTEKFECDQDKWSAAIAAESRALPNEVITSQGFGPTGWSLPPHVLLVDYMANTKGIVTPFGKFENRDFMKIADKAERKKAMDVFLDQMAKVLPTANYLHLYFRYFHEYVFDSPVTSLPNLLGSKAHCGDIHQTAYQSLERLMGGRYVGDCDDLAELFMNVTRRQGKLSYVMALPGHAACGWAEAPAAQGGDYAFYIDDTGPPRQFHDPNLEKVIEKASRAYDRDKTMRFDPKSLGFLFRFNGEQTRTPYSLSSRMYVDRVYGDAMERVQSYWHFHFYALGIKTMKEMIEKGDRVPENCVELAGLYGQTHEIEDSIKWTQEALKQFGPEDRASRFSEQFRIGMMYREDHHNDKAYESLKPMIAELRKLESDPQFFNFTSTRMGIMSLLENIGKPFDAWEVMQHDITLFASRPGLLRIEHVGGLTTIYRKMADAKRAGKTLDAREERLLKSLEKILTSFYNKALFGDPDDDLSAILRKYAFLGQWYAGKYGTERLQQELLKDGPWPEADKKRDHKAHTGGEEEDWKWIRLSLTSYSLLIGDAVDMDDPPEKWRKEDAVKLIDGMKRAAVHAAQFGSLGNEEFQLLSLRVTRAFFLKDWKDLEEVLKETQTRDWARLTSDIAENLGRGARFVSKEEFLPQFRLFTKYVKARPAYFTAVYEAYRADAYEHALSAAQIALECWPGDEDMVREAKYLKELVAKKLAAVKTEPAKSK